MSHCRREKDVVGRVSLLVSGFWCSGGRRSTIIIEVEKHLTTRWTDLDTVARMKMWNSAVRRQQKKMFIDFYTCKKI
ncbi:hypothetical protein RB195_015505 [Necator americanus]|uniref:Uncharacterized protein n=1 Tax=Necator americanus TaxID=51031 RepID=A0ABR1E5J0_NECAM